MEHGLNLAAVGAIAAAVVLWSVFSDRLERWNISAASALVGVGLVLANGPTGVLHVGIGATGIRELAEFTLAIVLFGDAAGVSVRELARDAALPGRLLLVGLPLTMAAGTVTAKLIFPGLSWWVCAVIGAAVAPTDAALGAPIIEDSRVPRRIRRVLNVESGLNDGIATPFVKFFLVAAVAGTSLQSVSETGALKELLLGAVGGALIGAIGGWLLVMARAYGLGGTAYGKLGATALAVLAYAGVVHVGGNGFVAAFVAGLAYGAVTTDRLEESLEFTHGVAGLMSLVVWFIFGAVMVPILQEVTWREVLFAALALTAVRLVPVALSLVGAGFDRATVGVIGWFGPRGLASVVFGLLAYDDLAPVDGHRTVRIITMTVVASVVLHGVSAAPVAARYGATHPD